ncbi:ABC transporter permease [Microbacterium halotolerans]|uniref:ABC transporter permease n=1 Tax=Microbacterium halotolerans TaxID=246613 RepID=UPI000E6AA3CF|nr:ABC transporter permease [Microbacterium halotolerans]
MADLRMAGVVWRLAVRDLWHGRARALLAVLVIGVTVAGGIAVDALVRSSEETDARFAERSLGEVANARVQWFGADSAQQSPRADLAFMGGDDLPIADVEDRLEELLPPGAATLPMLGGTVTLRSGGVLTDWVSALQGEVTDPAAAGLVSPWEGELPTAHDEVSLSRDLAQRLNLTVGDAVDGRAGHDEDFASLTVVGVHENNPRGSEVVMAAGSLLQTSATALADAATIWFVTGADLSWDWVLAGNELGFITVSRDVVLDPPASSQVPIFDGAPPESVTLGGIAVLVLAAVIVGGTLVVLLIAPVFAIGARRSRRDYALLRSHGASRRHIRDVMLRSSGLTGVIAAVIGTGAGLLIAAGIVMVAQLSGSTAFPDLRLPWLDALVFVLAGAGIALLAAWAPARRAMREDPLHAMRNSEPTAAVPWRRTLLIFLLLVAGGVAAAAVAAFTGQRWLLLIGGALAAVAVIVALPAALIPLSRLSARLPVASRAGVREAARRPSRTVPAVTGVAAALALAICISIVTATQYATAGSRWALRADPGTLLIYDGFYTAASGSENPFVDSSQVAGAGEESTTEGEAARQRLHDTIDRYIPGSDLYDVRMLALEGDPYPRILIPQGKPCPAWADYTEEYNRLTGRSPGTGRPAPASSQNCWIDKGITDLNRQPLWSTDDGGNIAVDDGTLITALGLPGADRAAQAIADGKIVLTRPLDLWEDGTAHLGIMGDDPVEMARWEQLLEDAGSQGVYENPPDPVEVDTVIADAVVMDWPTAQWQAFIPESLLAGAPLGEHAPVAERVGLVATGNGLMEVEALDELRNELLSLGVHEATQARDYANTGLATTLTSVTGVAALIALAATWGTAQLGITDMRPDLRLLHNIGTSPRTRRRIAASLTLVIGLLGTAAGTLCGIALGIGTAAAIAGDLDIDSGAWALTIPWWPVVGVGIGVPLITAALTWLRESTRR